MAGDNCRTGNLSLLLHAHLPFVRNLKPYISLEEKWLFEALTESYLPLLLSWEKLMAEGLNFKLNISLSPSLISMLIDPRLQERYGGYLRSLIELSEREMERTAGDPVFSELVQFYHRRLSHIEGAFNDTYQGDILKPIKKFHDLGFLEIITTCATHGYLPLILTEEARRVQVKVALELFYDVFGHIPAGFWLPECGYGPGIENILHVQGIKYFIVASHGMLNAFPRVRSAVYAPVKTANGMAVFGRDWETSHQVWSRTEGYPGDPVYREFYRDIGFDLDFSYLEPYLTGGIRGDTGFKYYRITGKHHDKEPYNPQAARGKAREHAADFIRNREMQLAYWAGISPDNPVVVAPYDAELFGHWWFEGPVWLEEVLRLSAAPDSKIRLTTFSEYLNYCPPRQEVALAPSSWGEGGYNRVWLNPVNDYLYPHIHRAEKAITTLAAKNFDISPVQERVLNQAARELLLAQSSDWPFMLTSQTMVDYARSRVDEHLSNFFKLFGDYHHNTIDEDYLRELEERNNIFPGVDFRYYRPERPQLPGTCLSANGKDPVVLMLSWEYPPYHVGGLGIHVRDLSEALTGMGVNIHVLTQAPGGSVVSNVREGVNIHCLPTYQKPGETDFISWILQLNLSIGDFARILVGYFPKNRLIIHAHDWLTAYAARELKDAFGLPLITTIHATEYGRHRGLHNHLQHAIHGEEAKLVAIADRVICCSRYMEKEINGLFQLNEGKLKLIPNAVKPIKLISRAKDGYNILFVGRLVGEKGVQILLEAFARLLQLYPQAKLVIAGDGPYADSLKALTAELGIGDSTEFAGFVSEKVRNQLLARSNAAVFPSLYEPFGIVALEAMAAGVPVIVSRTGGLAEVVEDGVTGLSFNPGDVEDLLRCLVLLFQNPEMAAELSRRGQKRVNEHYTWESVARQTLELYGEIIRERNSNNTVYQEGQNEFTPYILR